MSVFRTVFKNICVLSLAGLISQIITIGIDILIARQYGVIQYGYYATALAFVSFFVLFCDAGMDPLLLLEGSRNKRTISVHLGNSLVVKIAIGLIIYPFMVLLAFFCHYSYLTIVLICLFGISNFIDVIKTSFYTVFQIFQKMEWISLIKVTTALLILFGALGVVFFHRGLALLGGVYIVIAFISVFFVLLIQKKFTPLDKKHLNIINTKRNNYLTGFTAIQIEFNKIIPMLKKSYLFALSYVFF